MSSWTWIQPLMIFTVAKYHCSFVIESSHSPRQTEIIAPSFLVAADMISNVNSLAIVMPSICDPLALMTSLWSIILTLYLLDAFIITMALPARAFSKLAHRHDRHRIYCCVLLCFRGKIEIDHSYDLCFCDLCCYSWHSTLGADRRGHWTTGPTCAVPGVPAHTTPAQTVSWSIPIWHGCR